MDSVHAPPGSRRVRSSRCPRGPLASAHPCARVGKLRSEVNDTIAIIDDPVIAALVIGVVATLVSVIALIGGVAGKRDPKPLRPLTSTKTGLSSADVLARATAAARQHAAGASLPRYTLETVRPVSPDGQAGTVPDGDSRSRAEARAKASAIVIHVAQHDPERMAEVIKAWMRIDPGSS
jgi:hypothetical protein